MFQYKMENCVYVFFARESFHSRAKLLITLFFLSISYLVNVERELSI